MFQEDAINALGSVEEAKVKLKELCNLFMFLPIGIYRSSIKDGTFLEANHECAQILGFDTVEHLKALAKTTDFYVNEKDRTKFINTLKRKKQIRLYELEFKLSDGERISVAVTARINEAEGYLEGSIMDITSVKNITSELEEYRNRESGELAKIKAKALAKINGLD